MVAVTLPVYLCFFAFFLAGGGKFLCIDLCCVVAVAVMSSGYYCKQIYLKQHVQVVTSTILIFCAYITIFVYLLQGSVSLVIKIFFLCRYF